MIAENSTQPQQENQPQMASRGTTTAPPEDVTLVSYELDFGTFMKNAGLTKNNEMHVYAVKIPAGANYKTFFKGPPLVPAQGKTSSKILVVIPNRKPPFEPQEVTPQVAGEPPFGSSVAHGESGTSDEFTGPTLETIYYFMIKEDRDALLAGQYEFGVASLDVIAAKVANTRS